MTIRSQTEVAPGRPAGLFSIKNLLTVLVILGCGALTIGVARFALLAQSQRIDIGDGGFLSQEPCGPPCFLQITPGVTSRGDAITILHAQAFSGSCAETGTGINCQGLLQIGFQKDAVNMVSFKPNAGITAAETIARYGPPDRIFVFISSLVPGGQTASKMRLFYDGMHAMIDLPDQNDVYFVARADLALSNIAYLSAAEYRSYQQQIAAQAVAWQGYRTYQAETQP